MLENMPDGWLYSMTYCIICGEYPISDAYISAYFIKFIMENVYFRCTLPLGTTLMTFMEINSHHKNVYLTYFWNALAAFLVKERRSILNIRGKSFVRTILVKTDYVTKSIITSKDSKATNSWKNGEGFFSDKEQSNFSGVVSS